MDTIREEVVKFMESNRVLTKLQGEDWYNMEDGLVALCEKVSGKKDMTYEQVCDELQRINHQVGIIKIVDNWLNWACIDDETKEDFSDDVLRLKNKEFAEVIELTNEYFLHYNTDGEIDGLAQDIVDYLQEVGV